MYRAPILADYGALPRCTGPCGAPAQLPPCVSRAYWSSRSSTRGSCRAAESAQTPGGTVAGSVRALAVKPRQPRWQLDDSTVGQETSAEKSAPATRGRLPVISPRVHPRRLGALRGPQDALIPPRSCLCTSAPAPRRHHRLDCFATVTQLADKSAARDPTNLSRTPCLDSNGGGAPLCSDTTSTVRPLGAPATPRPTEPLAASA